MKLPVGPLDIDFDYVEIPHYATPSRTMSAFPSQTKKFTSTAVSTYLLPSNLFFFFKFASKINKSRSLRCHGISFHEMYSMRKKSTESFFLRVSHAVSLQRMVFVLFLSQQRDLLGFFDIDINTLPFFFLPFTNVGRAFGNIKGYRMIGPWLFLAWPAFPYLLFCMSYISFCVSVYRRIGI